MTLPLNPDRQCAGKSTYATKAEAKRAALRTQTISGKTKDGALKAYKCPHGNHFHFGHMTPELIARLRVAWEDDADL